MAILNGGIIDIIIKTTPPATSAIAGEQKISLRIKVTLAQLQQLDQKETITVPFKGRNLEITCKGKVESE